MTPERRVQIPVQKPGYPGGNLGRTGTLPDRSGMHTSPPLGPLIIMLGEVSTNKGITHAPGDMFQNN